MFKKIIKIDRLICHSGGAVGSDTYWKKKTEEYGGKTYAYSYKTEYHHSKNKIEISDDDFQEGITEVRKANRFLKRKNIVAYMNLLSRNWQQVKNSNHILAVGYIKQKSISPIIDGGTGYAVMMAFNHNKPITVFDQFENKCYQWSYITNVFKEIEVDNVRILSENFCGIGTRKLRDNGKKFIDTVFENYENL